MLHIFLMNQGTSQFLTNIYHNTKTYSFQNLANSLAFNQQILLALIPI